MKPFKVQTVKKKK